VEAVSDIPAAAVDPVIRTLEKKRKKVKENA
jgi:hypothetical protein